MLLPRTDLGVAVQLIVATAVFAAVMLWVRQRQGVRVFVAGLWVMTYALMALRAVH